MQVLRIKTPSSRLPPAQGQTRTRHKKQAISAAQDSAGASKREEHELAKESVKQTLSLDVPAGETPSSHVRQARFVYSDSESSSDSDNDVELAVRSLEDVRTANAELWWRKKYDSRSSLAKVVSLPARARAPPKHASHVATTDKLNAHYMKQCPPGDTARKEDWSRAELRRLVRLLDERPVESYDFQWGLWSLHFAHRTGAQCLEAAKRLASLGILDLPSFALTSDVKTLMNHTELKQPTAPRTPSKRRNYTPPTTLSKASRLVPPPLPPTMPPLPSIQEDKQAPAVQPKRTVRAPSPTVPAPSPTVPPSKVTVAAPKPTVRSMVPEKKPPTTVVAVPKSPSLRVSVKPTVSVPPQVAIQVTAPVTAQMTTQVTPPRLAKVTAPQVTPPRLAKMAPPQATPPRVAKVTPPQATQVARVIIPVVSVPRAPVHRVPASTRPVTVTRVAPAPVSTVSAVSSVPAVPVPVPAAPVPRVDTMRDSSDDDDDDCFAALCNPLLDSLETTWKRAPRVLSADDVQARAAFHSHIRQLHSSPASF